MAFFDIFTRKKQERKETSSGSPEFKYAEKKAAECAQNVLSKKLPVPPPFGDDKHFKDAASMLLSMTGALFPSNDTHNESEIDQALSLYAYIFTAKSGGFIPERSESWVVKRRALIRSMKAIEEGIFAREGVQKATQIALEYIYSHIPFFADKDSAYLNSIKEMKSLLLPLSKLASGQKESPDLAASVRSCVQKANQLVKEGHQAWAAEWIEALIDTLSPVDPCYDDPSGKALFEGSLMEYMLAVVQCSCKDIIQSMVPYKSIYKLYGFLLTELGYYDDALIALRHAQAYNPYSIDVMGETVFVFGKLNRWEEAEKTVWKMLDCAYTRQHFAIAFRAMGSVYVHKELWNSAMACYQASLYYQPESAVAVNEIEYITQQSGIHQLSDDEASAELQKCGLPSMINIIIYQIADRGAKGYQNNSNSNAKYFESVLNEATVLTYIATEKMGYMKGIEHK